MAHVLFPISLYVLGLILLLPAKPTLPERFVAWTAFAWGALAWITGALLVLILPVPYTPATVFTSTLLLSSAVFLLLQRRSGQRIRVSGHTYLWPAGLFVVVVSIPALLRVVHVLPDSFDMLLIARDIAQGETSAATLSNMGLYGPAWPLLHTAATWSGLGFFYSLPAAVAFTLVASLRYFCHEGLQRLGWPASDATRPANLVTLFFATTFWVFLQLTYYHNGSLAAVYLLLGMGGIWLALVDGQQAWLWVGAIALIGLGLARAETILFSVAFFAIAISVGCFPGQWWVRALLPFTVLNLAWYSWLGLVARPDTVYLTPLRIALFASMVALLLVGALALNNTRLRNLLLPRLYQLLVAGLGVTVAGLILILPQQSARPLWSTAANFFLTGTLWWGLIWWLLVAAFVLLGRAPRFPYQPLFTGVILAFLALYLMLGIITGDFLIRADSSGSRMALHILPVILLFLTFRAAPYLAVASEER